MKKAIAILLLLGCILSLLGCQAEHDAPQVPVTVYYKRAQMEYGTADGVIIKATLESAGHETDTVYLLQQYLCGTDRSDLSPTFPVDTRLISYHLEGLTAKIVLSDQLAQLTGIELSIACACLSKTVMSLSGCREVIISAEHAQLDNNNYITVSSNSYLMQDLSGESGSN